MLRSARLMPSGPIGIGEATISRNSWTTITLRISRGLAKSITRALTTIDLAVAVVFPLVNAQTTHSLNKQKYEDYINDSSSSAPAW